VLSDRGAYASITPARGSESGAQRLQARATELSIKRGTYMHENGTVAAIRGRNRLSGEERIFIATEAPTIPKALNDSLRPGEVFVEGVGHAEETIIKNVGREWELVEGGTSRNVCKDPCFPLLDQEGFTLGGRFYPGRLKTKFRMFWKEWDD